MYKPLSLDHYQPERIQATDYYAYGLELPGRSYTNTAYSATNDYRYGFNEDRLILAVLEIE